MLELVEQLALHPQDFTRQDYERALADGITETEYVEVVALVARSVNLDVFAHAIGISPRPLARTVDGEPHLKRPETAIDEGAWVATIPADARGASPGKALYGAGMMPFIYRALSLVPQEAARVIAGGNAQYLNLTNFMDYSYTPYPSLSRPLKNVKEE